MPSHLYSLTIVMERVNLTLDLHSNSGHCPNVTAGVDGISGVFAVASTVYLAVLSIGITFGNALTVFALWNNSLIYKETYYSILSLAVSDFLIGVVTIPSYIAWLYSSLIDLGHDLCLAIIASSLFLTVASMLNLLLVGIERFIAVCFPLMHLKIRARRAPFLVCICSVWVCSLVATLLSMLAADPDFETCAYYDIFDETFLVSAIASGVFLPLILLLMMYACIHCKIQSHYKFVSRSSKKSRSSSMQSWETARIKASFKTSKTMALVVICFALCWGPLFITMLLRSVCQWCRLPWVANEVILLLGFTNSFLNPIIYSLRHKTARTYVNRILYTPCHF
ncbi:5-hydroxytryptamine receptor 4-like [Saccostrea echinata]|uniref:5-hydroxytryptamine receptor 4-like n=1 Tax=Saccostrea echinata TaxID=191078 RepID=UPI002A7F1035|nr:5-hydroxytryptamine receptor 4-like [Saccostrea echinata]